MKFAVSEALTREFGGPSRQTVKVRAWDVGVSMGAVLQIDQPSRDDAAVLWLPYPEGGQTVPDISLAYAGESGRHSGTYATHGLRKGEPALKLTIRTDQELEATLSYIRAMRDAKPLPEVRQSVSVAAPQTTEGFSPPAPMRPRREAIPRAVQREVWQRDGGLCVECGTRERLCFDHIVPFSRGGSNTIRNIQLLCESCNLSKGNRL